MEEGVRLQFLLRAQYLYRAQPEPYLSENQAEYTPPAGAESHPNADLTRSLRNDLGQECIKTKNRQYQRQEGKDADQIHC